MVAVITPEAVMERRPSGSTIPGTAGEFPIRIARWRRVLAATAREMSPSLRAAAWVAAPIMAAVMTAVREETSAAAGGLRPQVGSDLRLEINKVGGPLRAPDPSAIRTLRIRPVAQADIAQGKTARPVTSRAS